uniref:Gustatory receptor n=1 Tax=Anopheles dirus TaxID=7168 RepID=A0A182NBX9_9DIPT
MSVCIRQNRFTFYFNTTIYFLPVGYDQTVNRFVMNRLNSVAFFIGILMSMGYIYHDFFMHIIYIDYNYAPFTLAVFLLELVVFAVVPISTIFNNFNHRDEMLAMLNVLYADDDVAESSSATAKFQFLSMIYHRYVKLVNAVIILLIIYNFTDRKELVDALYECSIVTRYLIAIQFVCLYHLSVSMIGTRMQQLKSLFLKYQNEHDFDHFLGIFMERFERYVTQIEHINRCFSIPLLGMMLQAMIELSYFAYESYRVISTLQVIDANYPTVHHWILIQFFLAMHGNVFLLAVSSCEEVKNKVEETALCTRHFDDYRLQNTRAAKQIQKFLLKNLHQKKKFSACGFFDIDNTVIYMVFSSIVTYLVILIQFKQLETDLTQSEGVFNVTSNLTTPGPS